MIEDPLIQRIENLIIPVLQENTIDLVDLHIRRFRGQIYIGILADKPFGGITLQECSILNTKIVAALEREQLIMENYVLEVSSPGVDRPLKTGKDFLRVLNRQIVFYLSSPIQERIEWQGNVKRVESDSVVIDVASQEMTIPLSSINKARQIL